MFCLLTPSPSFFFSDHQHCVCALFKFVCKCVTRKDILRFCIESCRIVHFISSVSEKPVSAKPKKNGCTQGKELTWHSEEEEESSEELRGGGGELSQFSICLPVFGKPLSRVLQPTFSNLKSSKCSPNILKSNKELNAE